MKSKTLIFAFFIFCILFLALGMASATDINTNLENISSEHIPSEKTFESIQNTIDNAEESDTILLEGTYPLSDKPIDINKSVTIKGTEKGAKLNGNTKNRVFNIKSDNVILENLILANGQSESGGSVYIEGNNVKIINCTFLNNRADLYGGAIFSQGNNVSIERCQFTGNVAKYTGGAIEIEGNNNIVDTCNFKDNLGGHVGADVAWVGLNGYLANSKFIKTNVDSKKASQYGGAVVWMGDNGHLTRSYFYQNQAKKSGAAVYWKGNNGNMNCCIFENNTSNNDSGYCGNPDYALSNYWGFNINSVEDFASARLICYNDSYNATKNWANIERTDSSVSFKLNDGSPLAGFLPDYEVEFLNARVIIHNNEYTLKGTEITASNIVTYSMYTGKYLMIMLSDENNRKAPSQYLEIKLNGVKHIEKTDTDGIVKIRIDIKKPGTYTADISFKGNAVYKASSKVVTVTVKKQKPTLSVKTKVLKLKSKRKIVKISLNDQFKKPMSKKTVKLTMNKKTYTAKTNSKGIASFKVILKAKKNYKFKTRFKENEYYKGVSKKGSIKVK